MTHDCTHSSSAPLIVRSLVTGLLVALMLTGCGTATRELRAATTTSVPVSTTTSGPSGTPTTVTIPTSEVAVSLTIADSTVVVPTSAPSDGSLLALDLLALVVVENERPDGYDRDVFGYPKSMGGGCNTRTEVLRRDSVPPAQIDPFGCTVIEGDWLSLYDRVHHTSPGDVEIDHVVALKEAWDSGAWRWDDSVRIAFANDLSDPRTLRAVTTSVNRAKSDKDPSNWLPPHPDDVCRYVGEWVAIKVRWGLSMDQSEAGRVRTLLSGQCLGARVAPIDV